MTRRLAPWTVVAAAAAIVTLAMGARQAFGLFLQPMAADIAISRSGFGLALAVQQLLFGLAQPFVGALADRHGAGRVVAVGAVVYVVGLVLAAAAASPGAIGLTLGLLVGVALAATTFVIVFGAVGQVVAPERRGLAFGLVSAGGSLGQFLLVPLSQWAIGAFGWRGALLLLAVLVALLVPLARGVAGRPRAAAGDATQEALWPTVRRALGYRDYRLLNAGFFVCGFHIAFIATHLPAYLTDLGLGAGTGAAALAAIGLFNIFGSYAFGLWSDRWPKNLVLSAIYAGRAVVIGLFLALPPSRLSALAFAAGIGFLWLGTVPPTSGLVGRMFGVRYLSTLYGIVFLSHQVGSFFGAWLGGLAYDRLGSYDVVWAVSIALALAAALVHLPIRDRAAMPAVA